MDSSLPVADSALGNTQGRTATKIRQDRRRSWVHCYAEEEGTDAVDVNGRMQMPHEEQNVLSRIVGGGLRSIGASFPGFATLGQAWSEYENYLAGNRIAELMKNLKTKVEELSTATADFEERCQRVREEFPSLLEIAIAKVRREFSEEKRRLYANVLASVSFEQCDELYENKVSILHSLDTLTPQDVATLKLFEQVDEAAAKDLAWRSLDLEGDDNQKLAELAGILARLESRGLIVTVRLHTGVTYVTGGLDPAVVRLRETVYRVLPMGKRILSVVK